MKMRSMCMVLLLALVLSLLGSSLAFAQEGTFRVGMECNYPPFNWTQAEEGEHTTPIESGAFAGGYDVQIAQKIAEHMGKELVIVKTEWDGLIPALNAGVIDAVIAGMSPTAERKLTVNFSDAYYTSELVIVVDKNGPYANAASLADFEGASITGQLTTLHYDVIDQIPGVHKLQAMDSFPAMVVALSSGAIDGYVSERPGAVSAASSNPNLSYIAFEEGQGFEVSPDDVAVAVALRMADEELLGQVNEAIAQISTEDQQALMADAIANQPLSE